MIKLNKDNYKELLIVGARFVSPAGNFCEIVHFPEFRDNRHSITVGPSTCRKYRDMSFTFIDNDTWNPFVMDNGGWGSLISSPALPPNTDDYLITY